MQFSQQLWEADVSNPILQKRSCQVREGVRGHGGKLDSQQDTHHQPYEVQRRVKSVEYRWFQQQRGCPRQAHDMPTEAPFCSEAVVSFLCCVMDHL